MKWKFPPKIKIYEALGVVGDKRITVSRNKAKVFSSSGNKFYEIEYDPKSGSIMSNDNGSYWQGYLGYPSIAFLMSREKIKYEAKFAGLLKGIKWKDINSKFKNDFSKTEAYIKEDLIRKGVNITEFENEITNIQEQIKTVKIGMLGKKKKPPQGY
ncbi:MAG: hypothetical protein WC608_01510 [Parcubacteria group bacterium]